MRQKISITIILLIAVCTYILLRDLTKRSTMTTASNKTLREDNSSFSAGIDASNQGNMELSQTYFNDALTKESSSRAKNIILLNKATAYLRLATSTSDKIKGIQQVNRLIDDPSTSNDIKAYAVQGLSQWYLAVKDKELYELIFEDIHYKKYRAENTGESINNLFVYALSFYPLSIPILKTTLWEAEIINSSSTVTKFEKNNFLSEVKRKLTQVDNDTLAVESGGNKIDTISIFLARARLLAALEKITGDKQFGDPVEYFNKAYERASLNNVNLTKGYIILGLSLYFFEKNDINNSDKAIMNLINDKGVLSSNFKIYLTNLSNTSEISLDKRTDVMLEQFTKRHSEFKEVLHRN